MYITSQAQIQAIIGTDPVAALTGRPNVTISQTGSWLNAEGVTVQ
jgi:hypothetical protein